MALTEEQKKHILHPNFGGSSSSQGSDVLVMPAEHITAKAPTGAELVVDSFAFDKATIPSAKLNDLKALRTRLSAAPGSTVRLIGHTDTVGTEQYNVKLGLARAVAVRDFLVAEKSVTPSAIKIESKGETTPARGEPPAKRDPDKGEEDPKNRRVEIFVVWSNGSSNSLRGSDVLVFPPDHITAGKPNGSNSGKGSAQGSGGTGGGGGGSEKGAGNGTAGKPGVPPATPQRGGGIRLPKVTLNIGVDLPEVPLGDFKVGGRLEYQVTLGLAQESGGVEGELKFKNLSKPEYSVKVKEKIAGGAKLTGGGKVSSDKGSLGVGVEFASDASPNRKHSLEFSPALVDKGKLKVGVLDWKETVPLKDGTFEIDGIKVDYSGSFVVTVSGTPDWVKIGQQVAERYGVDVAANAAVGGTGAAGALAVAAAPAAARCPRASAPRRLST